MEQADGRILSFHTDDRAGPAEAWAGVRAAILLPHTTDDHTPLLVAVRPDDDGIVRARWQIRPAAKSRWRTDSIAHNTRTSCSRRMTRCRRGWSLPGQVRNWPGRLPSPAGPR